MCEIIDIKKRYFEIILKIAFFDLSPVIIAVIFWRPNKLIRNIFRATYYNCDKQKDNEFWVHNKRLDYKISFKSIHFTVKKTSFKWSKSLSVVNKVESTTEAVAAIHK